MANSKSVLSRMMNGVAVLSLAAAFTLAPAAISIGSFDDAAYAQGKSGDKGNKGGDKGNKGGGKSNGGGKSKSYGGSDKQASGSGGQKVGLGKAIGNLFKKKQKPVTVVKAKPVRPSVAKAKKATAPAASAQVETVSLHPSQKGRWNAANANQNALDAHIRNGNFNGTVGALAQYQLAGKAASGAELTEAEKAALDNFVTVEDITYEDAELEALLNGDGTDDLDGDGLNDTLPNYEVVDGTATCVSNCDADGYDPATIDADANQALDDYTDANQQAAQDQAYSDFLSASEQRILDDSNKSTDGIEETLLDDIATQLGFERPEPVADDVYSEEEMDEPAMDDVYSEEELDDDSLISGDVYPEEMADASESQSLAEAAQATMLSFTEENASN